MTFEEAWKVAKKKYVRHPGMAPNWVMYRDKKGEHWFVNPHSGTNVQFNISDEEKKRYDWELA